MEQAIDYTYLDEVFEEAQEPEISNVPDGQYHTRIDTVEFRPSQAGNLMLNWDLIIKKGEYANRHLFERNMMMTNQNMGYLKKNLKTCGIDIHAADFKLSTFLQTRLGELQDLYLLVTVKNKPDSTGTMQSKVYFNRLLSEDEIENTDAEDGATEGATGATPVDPTDPFAEE